MNPNHAVPVYREGKEFVITEGSAIMTHIARQFKLSSYPTELRQRALCDQFMSWFSIGFAREYLYHYLYPQVHPEEHGRDDEAVTKSVVEWGRKHTLPLLKALNDHYLGGERKFLLSENISIADMWGASLLSFGEYAQLDFKASGYPWVHDWFLRVKAHHGWFAANAAHAAQVEHSVEKDPSGMHYQSLLTTSGWAGHTIAEWFRSAAGAVKSAATTVSDTTSAAVKAIVHPSAAQAEISKQPEATLSTAQTTPAPLLGAVPPL